MREAETAMVLAAAASSSSSFSFPFSLSANKFYDEIPHKSETQSQEVGSEPQDRSNFLKGLIPSSFHAFQEYTPCLSYNLVFEPGQAGWSILGMHHTLFHALAFLQC
jgi:hypothetical protein